MDIKEIKQLVKILNDSGLSAIEVTEGSAKIRIENSRTAGQNPEKEYAAPKQKEPAANIADTAQKGQGAIDFNRMTGVTAPLVGIFYNAPSPGAKPFVEVGSRVKKGDMLCIIEAMKNMNEITAETDGEIVDVCVQNGQLVEFSQLLFKIC